MRQDGRYCSHPACLRTTYRILAILPDGKRYLYCVRCGRRLDVLK